MKTREWILTILLIMLAQFIIQAAAWQYGESRSALSYISFAGTLISIILALLAIIYSFVQSVTQQNTSTNISHQVSELINVTDQIKDSKEELSLSLNTLKEVSGKIDHSLQSQHKIHEEVSNIGEKVSAIAINYIQSSEHHSKAQSNTKRYLNNEILSNGRNGLIINSLLILQGQKKGLKAKEIQSSFLKKFSSTMFSPEEENSEDDSHFIGFMEGSLLLTMQSLEALELIEIDKRDNVSIEENFKRECEDYIEKEINKNDDDFICNSIKSILKL